MLGAGGGRGAIFSPDLNPLVCHATNPQLHFAGSILLAVLPVYDIITSLILGIDKYCNLATLTAAMYKQ